MHSRFDIGEMCWWNAGEMMKSLDTFRRLRFGSVWPVRPDVLLSSTLLLVPSCLCISTHTHSLQLLHFVMARGSIDPNSAYRLSLPQLPDPHQPELWSFTMAP